MPPPPGLQLQVGVVLFVGVVPDTLGAVGAVVSITIVLEPDDDQLPVASLSWTKSVCDASLIPLPGV